jgi:NTE family protein
MASEKAADNRPLVGLALSGGAARGMAHVGVLRVLEEHGIPVDFIAGTSAGAIVGGAYAAGLSPDGLEDFALKMRWRDIGGLTLSRLGVQSNARFDEYLRQLLPVNTFAECRIPFAAVATDLRTGAPVILRDEGELSFAIRASCTLPGWYVPVTDAKGRQLVDGGVVQNIPAAAARAMGAEVVIAVDVNAEGAKFLGEPRSALGVMLQSLMIVQRAAAERQLEDADIVISPRIGHLRWDEMTRAAEFIEAGAQATRATLERIKRLTAPDAPLKWYQFFTGKPKRTPAHRRLSPLP